MVATGYGMMLMATTGRYSEQDVKMKLDLILIIKEPDVDMI
jgi:hypothetical protein